MAAALVALANTVPVAAQTDPLVESVLNRAVDISGCYELRWGDWTDEAWDGAEDEIPRRIWLTMTSFEPRYFRPDSSAVAIPFVVRPAPRERASGYHDVKWSAQSETDSISLSWSSTLQGIAAQLAVSGPLGERTLAGQAFAWTDELHIVEPGAPPYQPPSVTLTGSSVDCR